MKRRDLFKAAAMTATGVALGSLSDINTTFAKEVTKMTKEQFSTVFPMGAKNDAYAQYFVGQSYLNMLSLDQVVIGNVTFEPGCRNNWHIHHADKGGGQILLVTGGRGYYQEWGKPARELHAGDVVNIPAGVKHWHGAAPTSWFAHLAITVPGENSKNEWCEPVDAEEYNKLFISACYILLHQRARTIRSYCFRPEP